MRANSTVERLVWQIAGRLHQGKSDAIVTFNKNDFRGCDRFGVRLLTPAELLREIGGLK